MKHRVLSTLSVVAVLTLTACGQKWVSGQNVSPSKLPSAVVKSVDSESSENFSEAHPQIVSAVTETNNPGNVDVYELVVKGNFSYQGHTTNSLDIEIKRDGSAGEVMGNSAFDQTFVEAFGRAGG